MLATKYRLALLLFVILGLCFGDWEGVFVVRNAIGMRRVVDTERLER
jgi:hypothetical protein